MIEGSISPSCQFANQFVQFVERRVFGTNRLAAQARQGDCGPAHDRRPVGAG
jgi:hypothetical protein